MHCAGRTTYGGLSGNAIRPIALRLVWKLFKILHLHLLASFDATQRAFITCRAVSGIANSHDNQFPILATVNSTLTFIYHQFGVCGVKCKSCSQEMFIRIVMHISLRDIVHIHLDTLVHLLTLNRADVTAPIRPSSFCWAELTPCRSQPFLPTMTERKSSITL